MRVQSVLSSCVLGSVIVACSTAPSTDSRVVVPAPAVAAPAPGAAATETRIVAYFDGTFDPVTHKLTITYRDPVTGAVRPESTLGEGQNAGDVYMHTEGIGDARPGPVWNGGTMQLAAQVDAENGTGSEVGSLVANMTFIPPTVTLVPGGSTTCSGGSCNVAYGNVPPNGSFPTPVFTSAQPWTVDDSANSGGGFTIHGHVLGTVASGWTINGSFLTLNKTSPTSAVFSQNDCDQTSFAATPDTVNAVPYDVGDPSLPFIQGVPEGTSTVQMPGSNWLLNHAYMIFPGGRGNDLPFQVTFNYTDSTSTGAGLVTIPHDCGGGGPITSGSTTNIIDEGGYVPLSTGANCCVEWWEGTFTNPNPAKAVQSLTIFYSPANNASWGFGRVWAITID